MMVKIKRAGFVTTIQDPGRCGYRQFGVPLGGALDRHALRVANELVGNEPGAAGIEFTLGTLGLECEDERIVAWCGGDFRAAAGEVNVPAGHAFVLEAGEELRVTPQSRGGRLWLAISGGLEVPAVLGSRSTELRSCFGGLQGRALRNGDTLTLGARSAACERFVTRIGAGKVSTWSAPSEWATTKPRHPILRVVKGSDPQRLKSSDWDRFLRESFTVAPDSDRMGVRLEGIQFRCDLNGDLLSEAVAPGTVQLPPGGKPIVLLGDCQTIGGYPKVAHVITADLSVAAQLQPGDTVRFAEVSLADAQRFLLERQRDFARFRVGLELLGK